MNWRRNATSLSQIEKGLFIKAVQILKTPVGREPPTGPTSRYNQYVAWHFDAANYHTNPDGDGYRVAAHSGPAFLPWHREFLRRFELDLQTAQTGVTLPYWNWAEDASLPDPKGAPIWNNFMGGDGDPDPNNHNIVKGLSPPDIYGNPFAVGNWRIADGNGRPSSTSDNPQGALQRALGKYNEDGITIPTLPTLNDVNSALSEFPYDQWQWNRDSSNPNNRMSFRNKLEGWEGLMLGNIELHNRVHLWVGGSMEPPTSPNDPVFFLHHCYVDRIWDRWQISYANTGNDYPADGTITTQSPGGQRIVGHNRNDSMYPWNDKTVSSVLPSLEIEVEYDPGNHAITAVATGSGNLEVFWIGRDGSVNGRSYVNQNQSWGYPYHLPVPNGVAGPGSASVPSGSITAIYDQQRNLLHIWWTRPDSSVEHMTGGFVNGQVTLIPMPRVVNYSSTSGGIAGLWYGGLPFMFCIGCDSNVYWEYWDGSNWFSYTLPSMKRSSTSSGLAAVSRSANYMDVFWIEGDGSVKGQLFTYPSTWGNPYQIAEPGSAWGNSIVAVSRDTDKIDVWWIGPTDSGQRTARPYSQNGYVYWNSFADGQWKGKRAINTGGSIRGGMAAVARGSNDIDVYWIYNGGVYGMSWNSSNGWGSTYTLYGLPASTSGGLAASMRTSNDIDILWIGSDHSVLGTNLNYQAWSQTPFKALPSEDPSFSVYAASTGLPSDGGR